jgi:hypothetical protein
MNSSANDADSSKAAIRISIVKGLFAISVSVGFAATLARMDWIRDGSVPTFDEAQQIVSLLTALVATLLSWDNYLQSVHTKPLRRFSRFAIDIMLVFIYMFLLMSSRHLSIFLWTLAAIFALYVIWDILTVREYFAQYVKGARNLLHPSSAKIISVYVRGARNERDTSRGPIITLSWAFYFIFLAAIITNVSLGHVIAACIFAFVGLVGYRLDKSRSSGKVGVGFNMIGRLLVVVFLLGLSFIYFYAQRAL